MAGRGVSAASAGAMMVAIGLVVGVQDISALLMLFGLAAMMGLLCLVREMNHKTVGNINWLSYGVGCIAGALPWIVVLIYLSAGSVSGSVPAFVYWIVGSMLVLAAAFAANVYLQYRKVGSWTNYLYSERVFMILSLVAKTALAWQIFAGSLRP